MKDDTIFDFMCRKSYHDCNFFLYLIVALSTAHCGDTVTDREFNDDKKKKKELKDFETTIAKNILQKRKDDNPKGIECRIDAINQK